MELSNTYEMYIIIVYFRPDAANLLQRREQARQLATLLEKRRMHVNLLVYNPTGPGLSGVAYEPPPRETIGVFLDELHARGIVAHFRRPRGAAIDGACGQLRARAGG